MLIRALPFLFDFKTTVTELLAGLVGDIAEAIYGPLDRRGLSIDSLMENVENNRAMGYFNLGKGNLYGVLGAKMFVATRNIFLILIGLVFMFSLLRAAISPSPAKKMEAKSAITNVSLAMFMVAWAPAILNFFFFLRRFFVDTVYDGLGLGGGTSLGDLYSDYDGDLMLALMFLAFAIVGVYFAVFYISIAIMQLMLLGVFPIIALQSVSNPDLVRSWFKTFLGWTLIPMVDCVLFIVPAGLASMDAPALVSLVSMFALLPVRKFVFSKLGIEAADIAGQIAAGTTGAMAAALERGAGKVKDTVAGAADDIKKAREDRADAGTEEELAENERNQDAEASAMVSADGSSPTSHGAPSEPGESADSSANASSGSAASAERLAVATEGHPINDMGRDPEDASSGGSYAESVSGGPELTVGAGQGPAEGAGQSSDGSPIDGTGTDASESAARGTEPIVSSDNGDVAFAGADGESGPIGEQEIADGSAGPQSATLNAEGESAASSGNAGGRPVTEISGRDSSYDGRAWTPYDTAQRQNAGRSGGRDANDDARNREAEIYGRRANVNNFEKYKGKLSHEQMAAFYRQRSSAGRVAGSVLGRAGKNFVTGVGGQIGTMGGAMLGAGGANQGARWGEAVGEAAAVTGSTTVRGAFAVGQNVAGRVKKEKIKEAAIAYGADAPIEWDDGREVGEGSIIGAPAGEEFASASGATAPVRTAFNASPIDETYAGASEAELDTMVSGAVMDGGEPASQGAQQELGEMYATGGQQNDAEAACADVFANGLQQRDGTNISNLDAIAAVFANTPDLGGYYGREQGKAVPTMAFPTMANAKGAYVGSVSRSMLAASVRNSGGSAINFSDEATATAAKQQFQSLARTCQGKYVPGSGGKGSYFAALTPEEINKHAEAIRILNGGAKGQTSCAFQRLDTMRQAAASANGGEPVVYNWSRNKTVTRNGKPVQQLQGRRVSGLSGAVATTAGSTVPVYARPMQPTPAAMPSAAVQQTAGQPMPGPQMTVEQTLGQPISEPDVITAQTAGQPISEAYSAPPVSGQSAERSAPETYAEPPVTGQYVEQSAPEMYAEPPVTGQYVEQSAPEPYPGVPVTPSGTASQPNVRFETDFSASIMAQEAATDQAVAASQAVANATQPPHVHGRDIDDMNYTQEEMMRGMQIESQRRFESRFVQEVMNRDATQEQLRRAEGLQQLFNQSPNPTESRRNTPPSNDGDGSNRDPAQ